MSDNKNLIKAKREKNDEFYTQLKDIEAELCYYEPYLRGKVIYCNTDDPEYSNFWRYFHQNFSRLGLKRLISTYYGSDAYRTDYTGGNDSDISFYVKTKLNDNGDFRSSECMEVLEESDIVITNPPFSLFRPFISQLLDYEKKFLIIGSINAVTYKEIFPFIKDNKIWLGKSVRSGDMEFGVPSSYPLKAARVDGNGNKFIRVKVRWFTNLGVRRCISLKLTQSYWENPEKYPHYDNYDAIEVSRVKDIPYDYFETMGVPITFLDKYNPDQFEIIDIAKRGAGDPSMRSHVYTEEEYSNSGDLNGGPAVWIDGKLKAIYTRLLIKRKN